MILDKRVEQRCGLLLDGRVFLGLAQGRSRSPTRGLQQTQILRSGREDGIVLPGEESHQILVECEDIRCLREPRHRMPSRSQAPSRTNLPGHLRVQVSVTSQWLDETRALPVRDAEPLVLGGAAPRLTVSPSRAESRAVRDAHL